MVREHHGTATSIPTHAALGAIGVEIDHTEIITRLVSDENQTVGSDTEMSVAKSCDQTGIRGELFITIIDHNKIIAGTLVFVKMDSHGIGIKCRGKITTSAAILITLRLKMAAPVFISEF